MRVDEFYISRIFLNQLGSFKFAGEEYYLSINKIYPQVTNGSFLVDMIFIDKTPDGIKRGQSVSVKLALSAEEKGLLLAKGGFSEVITHPPGTPRTAFNWPVTPQGHFYGPKFAFERYRKPIVITENGLSNRDWVDRNGEVHDDQRVDFIETHLEALSRAGKSDVDLHGYFHWSLMDNFEWNHGYRERFGLVHVDYQTFERTKKKSFYRYSEIIAQSRGD